MMTADLWSGPGEMRTRCRGNEQAYAEKLNQSADTGHGIRRLFASSSWRPPTDAARRPETPGEPGADAVRTRFMARCGPEKTGR